MRRRALLVNLLAAPLAGCWPDSSPTGSAAVSGEGADAGAPIAPDAGIATPAPPSTTPGADWPVKVSLAPAPSPAPSLAMPVPRYLEPVLDPRMAPPNVAPGLASTRLTRISDAGTFRPPITPPGWNNFGPIYALQQHWSKDGTRMLVRAISAQVDGTENPHAYYTAMHLLDGRTYAYIAPCVDAGLRGLQSQWRWSNLVDDEIVCLNAIDDQYAEPMLYRFTPSTLSFSVLKDFAPAYARQYVGFKYTGEDTQTRDGRLWALLLRKPSGRWSIVVWSRAADAVAREWTISDDATSHDISFGLSPLGTYLWCASFGGELVDGRALAPGVSVFSVANGTLVSHLGVMNGATRPIGHTGANTDAAGNEVWVWMHGEPGAALNERGLRSWRMDGSAPTDYTRQLPDGIFLGFEYLNQSVPGHVVVSDYPVPINNPLYDEFPLRGQMFVVRLDGSGQVRLVTAARFSNTNHFALQNNGYAFYPWATPNRDLSRVLFKSGMNLDWALGAPAEFHAYVAAQG